MLFSVLIPVFIKKNCIIILSKHNNLRLELVKHNVAKNAFRDKEMGPPGINKFSAINQLF